MEAVPERTRTRTRDFWPCAVVARISTHTMPSGVLDAAGLPLSQLIARFTVA